MLDSVGAMRVGGGGRCSASDRDMLVMCRASAAAPPRTLTASPHSHNSGVAARTARPASPQAHFGVPPRHAGLASASDVGDASGRTLMDARRMSCSQSISMPGRSPSGGVSMDASLSAPSSEQLSQAHAAAHAPLLPRAGMWRWGQDSLSGEYRPPGAPGAGAMPPLKVARPPPPPPYFQNEAAPRPHDAMFHARSAAAVQQRQLMAASAHMTHSRQSDPDLHRAVTRSLSTGMPPLTASRRAHAAGWHLRRPHEPVWRMQTGEVPLAGPDDHSDGGVFQRWGGSMAWSAQGSRTQRGQHLQVPERSTPRTSRPAHASVMPQGGMPQGRLQQGGMPQGGMPQGGMPQGGMQMQNRRGVGATQLAAPGGRDTSQLLSNSEPVGTTAPRVHLSDVSSVGMAIPDGSAMPIADTAHNWGGPPWGRPPGGIRDTSHGLGHARSAPAHLMWPQQWREAPRGPVQDPLLACVDPLADLDDAMLDGLDLGLTQEQRTHARVASGED